MLKMPYEEILYKIESQANLKPSEINIKVDEKMKQLSGLVSKEGAAHIVANELGVKLFESAPSKLMIRHLVAGMRNVEISAKILKIYEPKSFDKNGKKGKVGSAYVSDGTSGIRIVFWNEQTDKMANLKEGDTVKVSAGSVTSRNGYMELHLNEKSEITINPVGLNIDSAQRKQSERSLIADLVEGESEILGVVVSAFDPRFFEVCPTCQKRARPDGADFKCETHGVVKPAFGCVLNAVIDDGTETIRAVFFKKQILRLFNLSDDKIETLRDFEPMKKELIGTIVRLVGKASKNQMSEKLEFVAQLVFVNPDPMAEVSKLEKQLLSLRSRVAPVIENDDLDEPKNFEEEIADNVELVDD